MSVQSDESVTSVITDVYLKWELLLYLNVQSFYSPVAIRDCDSGTSRRCVSFSERLERSVVGLYGRPLGDIPQSRSGGA